MPKKSSVEPGAPTTAQSYGMLFCFGRRSEGVQGAFRSPPACIAAHQLRRRGILAEGLTRRLRRGWWAAAPRGAVLSFEAKESTKESPRHGDSRGGPPRFALFANIGVPGTAVPGSCICSGLPVANCLRQLCPLGTRSLSAQASVCGSPFGAVLEHGVSGVAQLPTGRSARLPPSLRVALGYTQGPTGATLPFGTVRYAHPPGKSPLLPIFERGSSQCRAQWSWTAFTCSWSALVLTLFLFQKGQGFFPPLPIAALLPRS